VPVSVTLACPNDAQAIANIARLCALEVDVECELARDWAHLWVARAADGPEPVVGMLLAWEVADELHLLDLGTHPDHRRQGVARRLLEALLRHGEARRIRLVILEVRRSNQAARRLYRSSGFSEVDVREAYYANPLEDAIVMHLELQPAATGTALAPRSDRPARP